MTDSERIRFVSRMWVNVAPVQDDNGRYTAWIANSQDIVAWGAGKTWGEAVDQLAKAKLMQDMQDRQDKERLNPVLL